MQNISLNLWKAISPCAILTTVIFITIDSLTPITATWRSSQWFSQWFQELRPIKKAPRNKNNNVICLPLLVDLKSISFALCTSVVNVESMWIPVCLPLTQTLCPLLPFALSFSQRHQEKNKEIWLPAQASAPEACSVVGIEAACFPP